MDPTIARPLPRGRHGLPREAVLASQRGRMLVAMTQIVAERGFARTTVADVLRNAGVSRETFYEHFTGKDDCFMKMLDGAAALLTDGVRDAYEHAPTPADRLPAVLEVYLGRLAAEPAAARAFLIEAYAAGEPAVARRVALMDGFVELVCGLVDAQGPQARFRCEAFVAAVSALVTMRVAAGRTATLPELHGPLLSLAHDLLGEREA